MALAAKQPHSMILPPTHWTIGVVFLGSEASPSLLQTSCCSLWANYSVFDPSDHRVFLQRVFSLSMWSAAIFSWALRCRIWRKAFSLVRPLLSSCWCKTHLTVVTGTSPPAASNSLQTRLFVVFGWLVTICFSLSSRWCFVFSSWSWQWHNCAMHSILRNSCLYSWSWDL